MSKRERQEYLRNWKQKKSEEDPEYFKKASRKAAEKRKEKLKANPDLLEKERERSKGYSKKSRINNPIKHMLYDAKKRAKKKGIEFNLKESDLEIPENCPVLGIPLFVGDGWRSHNSPSIDRIDNSKGYFPNNVKIVSLRANMLKNDGTLEELRLIVKYMEVNTDGLVCY